MFGRYSTPTDVRSHHLQSGRFRSAIGLAAEADASNFCYLFFDLPDASFVTLIERPLLYPLGTDESRMRQNLHVFGRGRLTDAEFPGDEHQTDTVFNKVAVDLRREVGLRVLQP